jgi:hypothetical protein
MVLGSRNLYLLSYQVSVLRKTVALWTYEKSIFVMFIGLLLEHMHFGVKIVITLHLKTNICAICYLHCQKHCYFKCDRFGLKYKFYRSDKIKWKNSCLKTYIF